jgi:hypothetical protein
MRVIAKLPCARAHAFQIAKRRAVSGMAENADVKHTQF